MTLNSLLTINYENLNNEEIEFLSETVNKNEDGKYLCFLKKILPLKSKFILKLFEEVINDYNDNKKVYMKRVSRDYIFISKIFTNLGLIENISKIKKHHYKLTQLGDDFNYFLKIIKKNKNLEIKSIKIKDLHLAHQSLLQSLLNDKIIKDTLNNPEKFEHNKTYKKIPFEILTNLGFLTRETSGGKIRHTRTENGNNVETKPVVKKIS